jgi:hypothetical protein
MQKQSEHVAHATDRIRPKTSRIRGVCGIRHPQEKVAAKINEEIAG